MRKKIMNVVLFLAVFAAALGMTLYVGNSAGKRADLQLYFSRYHCSCLYRGAVWRNVSHE